MAKIRNLDFLRELAAKYQDVTPAGFYSTADRLIQEAPMKKAPADQWLGYLKPGRVLKNQGQRINLGGSEMKESGLRATLEERKQETLSRERILELLRSNRPSLSNRTLAQGPEEGYESTRWDDYPNLKHDSPGSKYYEDVTSQEGIDFAQDHFDEDTMGWSRATTHELPENGGRLRIVEEVQSDVHSASGDDFHPDRAEAMSTPSQRQSVMEILQRDEPTRVDSLFRKRLAKEVGPRGYRTSEHQAEIEEIQESILPQDRIGVYLSSRPREAVKRQKLQRLWALNSIPPKALLSNPKEQGRFELRKQLLKAVENGDRYLAITSGDDQVKRYKQGMTPKREKGLRNFYDDVYPSELQRLARLVGARMVDIPSSIPISTGVDHRIQTLVELDMFDISSVTDHVGDLLSSGELEDAVNASNLMRSVYFDYRSDLEKLLPTMDPHAQDILKSQLKSFKEHYWRFKKELDSYTRSGLDETGPRYKREDEGVTDAENMFDNALREMENIHLEAVFPDNQLNASVKRFKALEITPEVEEEVKKGFSMYAKGGKVLQISKSLRRRLEAERSDLTSQEWEDRLRELVRSQSEVDTSDYVEALSAHKENLSLKETPLPLLQVPKGEGEILSWEQLEEYAVKEPQKAANALGADVEEGPLEDLDYLMSEMTDSMRDWLDERGLRIDDAGLHYDPRFREEIDRTLEQIQSEYDQAGRSGQKKGLKGPALLNVHPGELEKQPTWKQFNLYGDDDVDYNAGYIQAVLKLVDLVRGSKYAKGGKVLNLVKKLKMQREKEKGLREGYTPIFDDKGDVMGQSEGSSSNLTQAMLHENQGAMGRMEETHRQRLQELATGRGGSDVTSLRSENLTPFQLRIELPKGMTPEGIREELPFIIQDQLEETLLEAYIPPEEASQMAKFIFQRSEPSEEDFDAIVEAWGKEMGTEPKEAGARPNFYTVEMEGPRHLLEQFVEDLPDPEEFAIGGIVTQKDYEFAKEKLRGQAHKAGKRARRLGELTRLGFAEMTSSLDRETGKAGINSNFIDMETDAFLEQHDPETAREARRQRLRKDQPVPGLINDVLMLPAFAGDIGKALGKDTGNWGGAISRTALEETQLLRDSLKEQLNVEEPRGFVENSAEMLGMVLGQLPLPSKLVSAPLRMATQTARALPNPRQAAKWGKLIGKGLLAIPKNVGDFFGPFIRPGLKTYGSTALTGGALGSVADYLNTPTTAQVIIAAAQKKPGAEEYLRRLLEEGTPEQREEARRSVQQYHEWVDYKREQRRQKRQTASTAEFAKGGKISGLWKIMDRQTKEQVGATYKNLKRARTRVDKLDNEYGAYRYYVEKVPEEKLAKGGKIKSSLLKLRERLTEQSAMPELDLEGPRVKKGSELEPIPRPEASGPDDLLDRVTEGVVSPNERLGELAGKVLNTPITRRQLLKQAAGTLVSPKINPEKILQEDLEMYSPESIRPTSNPPTQQVLDLDDITDWMITTGRGEDSGFDPDDLLWDMAQGRDSDIGMGYLLSELSNEVQDQLEEMGMIYNPDENTIFYDPDQEPQIQELLDVMRAMHEGADDIPEDMLERYGDLYDSATDRKGEDWGDYNAGYPSGAMEVMDRYLHDVREGNWKQGSGLTITDSQELWKLKKEIERKKKP